MGEGGLPFLSSLVKKREGGETVTFADRLFNLSSKRRSEERRLASKQTVTTRNRAERTGNSTCMLQEGRAVSVRGLCENFALTAARVCMQTPSPLPYQIFQNRKEGGGGVALAQRVKLQKCAELKKSCAFAEKGTLPWFC